MTGEKVNIYNVLEERIGHLKELMIQHDRLTEIAIQKAETTLTERLEKVNYFREQQKDIIATRAGRKETEDAISSLTAKVDENIKSVTERTLANIKNVDDKINVLSSHLTEKISILKESLEGKGLATLKGMHEKLASNMKAESDRALVNEKQTKAMIDSNAELSNRGISELTKWKESSQGSIRVILAVGGFLVALVLALAIAVINRLL